MPEIVEGTSKEKVARTRAVIARYSNQIETLTPKLVRPEKMLLLAYHAVARQPKLAECSGASVVAGVLEASSFGLELNTKAGEAWLIPFFSSDLGYFEAQLVIGYRGFVQLGWRSERMSAVGANVVRDGDHFEAYLGTSPRIEHRPGAGTDYNDVTHSYAWFKTVYGPEPQICVMDAEELKRRRAMSKAPNSFAWTKHPEEMKKKAPVRVIFKMAPISSEASRAVGIDEAHEIGELREDPQAMVGEIIDVQLPDNDPIALQAGEAETEDALEGRLPGMRGRQEELVKRQETAPAPAARDLGDGEVLCDTVSCILPATPRSIEQGAPTCGEHGG